MSVLSKWLVRVSLHFWNLELARKGIRVFLCTFLLNTSVGWVSKLSEHYQLA